MSMVCWPTHGEELRSSLYATEEECLNTNMATAFARLAGVRRLAPRMGVHIDMARDTGPARASVGVSGQEDI